MFPFKYPNTTAIIGVGLFALAAVAGCNKPKSHHRAAGAAAASGSAGVVAAIASGPCQKYAAALCEKAGKESESCQALTTSAEILPPDACSAGLKDIAYSLKKLGDAGKSCED